MYPKLMSSDAKSDVLLSQTPKNADFDAKMTIFCTKMTIFGHILTIFLYNLIIFLISKTNESDVGYILGYMIEIGTL